MNRLFELPLQDYADLIRETARHMDVQEGIVEKDIWVCLALDCIFQSNEYGNHFIFKGGTSLSKVHKVIERFSEDVDLILNWELLGYGSRSSEPWDENRSNTQQDKLNKRMNEQATDYMRRSFVPWLQEEFSDLGDRAPTVTHAGDQIVQVHYAPAFQTSYVRNHVLLEIGPLASWVPQESVSIRPYVAEHFPDVTGHSEVPVRATTIDRTFWEKATILHEQYHNPKAAGRRYSRHYYDLYMMSQRGVTERALRNLSLLEDVARFKERFYYSGKARYDLARAGTLRLVPPEEKMDALRKDYEDMQVMFFRTPPDWEALIKELQYLETLINQNAQIRRGP